MADKTKIEWTDATWNPITGCAVVSPGCTNCYAMKLAGTRLKHHPSRKGLTVDSKAGPVWTGEIRFNEQWLDQPMRWQKRRRIFVCAHGDLFAEGVTVGMLDRIFAIMGLCPHHTFQVLTKRPERMRAYIASLGDGKSPDRVTEAAFTIGQSVRVHRGSGGMCERPLPNVWLGVSVEDQKRADERIPLLLETPAARRFISAEPLLGRIELKNICCLRDEAFIRFDALTAEAWVENSESASAYCNEADGITKLDWVIAGGESGPGARPMHPEWVRAIRDQCAASDTAFFFKQWGEWAPNVGAVDGWKISDDPEISRYEHLEWDGKSWGAPFRPMWCDWDNLDETQVVSRIGKKQAGRLLDGRNHGAMPNSRREKP